MATSAAANTRIEPLRIPLVGSYNTRLFGSAGNNSASAIVGIAIVGLSVVGSSASPTVLDQRLVNVIPDGLVTPITNAVKYYCYKRPGFATNTTPASGNIGTALRIWTGLSNEIISAFGDTNSTVYNGTTSLGSITGVAADIVEAVVGTTPTLLIPSNGNKLYYYQDGGAITEITDGDFPSNNSMTITGSPINMNGYTFIMTTNARIYNSDLNSISAWTSTSFLSVDKYPDRGVGLARHKDLVVAFGKESTEFFRIVFNESGSPLQNVSEAAIRIGCIGPESIVQFEDTVAWVGASDTGSTSVYMLEGYKPVRISDNVLDAFLALKSGTPVYLTAAKLRGKTFIFVIFGSFTWVYCIEDKMWHEWQPASSVLWHKFASSTSATEAIYSVSRHSTSGKVYILNPIVPVFTDDGSNYEFLLQTSKIDVNNTNRKRLHKLALVADNTTSATNMNISWSDDDYTTFTTARTVPMASTNKYLMSLGQFRRRAFRFSNTSSLPLRLEAIDLYYSQSMK